MMTLHVGAAQIAARHGDFTHNLGLIGEFAGQAAASGVEVLLFSEEALHGCTIAKEAVAAALPLDAAACRQVGAIANRQRLTLLVGFVEKDGNTAYNAHLIAHPDGTLQVQRKFALNEHELANGLTPGPVARIPIDIHGFRCCIAICADWGAKAIQEELDRQGCDLLFLPTSGGGTRADMIPRASLQTEDGIRQYVERMKRVAFPFDLIPYCLQKHRAVVTCNSVGDNGFDRCQEGHCIIMDHTGELVGLIPGAPVLEYQRSNLTHAKIAQR